MQQAAREHEGDGSAALRVHEYRSGSSVVVDQYAKRTKASTPLFHSTRGSACDFAHPVAQKFVQAVPVYGLGEILA